MNATEKVSNLNKIISDHSVFVFDLCGIVHDGQELIQDAVKFIYHLKDLGKDIVFLSNASRKRSAMKDVLVSFGFVIDDSYNIVTSGEFFLHRVKNDPSLSIRNKFFNIGTGYSYFEDGVMHFVHTIDECDYIIITLIAENLDNLQIFEEKLEEAAKKGKPALCINPDIYAPHGDITLYTPGYFANKYKNLGGKVTYFGKPHTPIYEFALSKYMKLKIPKSEIIAIGDSLITDVRGANNFGIKSLLVLRKGLHRDLYQQDEASILKVCEEYGVSPNYVIDDMVF